MHTSFSIFFPLHFCLQASPNVSMNLFSLETDMFVWWMCVLCVSLQRVMLSAENAWGTHLGPYLPPVAAPADILLPRATVMAGLALAILIMVAGRTSAPSVRELWKNEVYYSQVLASTQ